MSKFAPLQDIVDLDAFRWLQGHAPYYIDGIKKCLSNGATPSDIRSYISTSVGPDRQGLAIRCEQAARYILSSEDS